MRIHHTCSIKFVSLAFLVTASCSLDGQNILLESVGDSSGGQSSMVCGAEVWPAPIAIPDGTANAESNVLTVRNVATDHPLLTPNGDGLGDTTVFNADFEIVNPDVPGRTYTLDWQVNIKSLDSCAPALTLPHVEPVDFPESAIAYLEDFEGFPEGTIVTDQFDGFSVECGNRKRWKPDACILVDSQGNRCHSNFQSNSQGNVLVLAKNLRDRNKDGLVDHPDDASRGGTMTLNFDAPVTLNALTFQDVDYNENCDAIVTYADGTTQEFDIPRGPNKSLTTLTLGVSNATSVSLILRGSVALVNVDFTKAGEADGNAMLNVRDAWAGGGLPDGDYSFAIQGTLRDDLGNAVDTVTSRELGLRIDSSTVDYNQQPPTQSCDPLEDPTNCECPGDEPGCSVTYLQTLPNRAQMLLVGPSFISTTQDPQTGRYQVVADLRGGTAGLILKSNGEWDSAADLQNYIETLTGVPADPDGRLFNFDFTQLGGTVGVSPTGVTNYQFNNFLLDLITDEDGAITIDGTRLSVAEFVDSTNTGDPAYDVVNTYSGPGCNYVAAFNGNATLDAKFCLQNDGIALPGGLGLYNLRTSLFDTNQNGQPTATRETFCTGDGCAIRTRQSLVRITVDSFYFAVGPLGLDLVFNDQTSYDASSLGRVFDRGPISAPISGQCSRAIVENNDLRVRLDAAVGAVGTSCIINGYYD